MTDIHFYHLTTTPLARALPRLLEKSLQGGFRVLVLMDSDETVEAMNTLLWTYAPDSFLPHGSEKDGYSDAQPIYLTAKERNPNHSDLLVVTDGSELELENTVKRVLDVFDGSDDTAVAKARARWKRYQSEGHSVHYIKQSSSGNWEKQSA